SVTGAKAPKLPQLPFVSGASARSTTPLAGSRPDSPSAPSASVSGIDVLVCQGPPARATVWPAGGVESGLSVKSAVAVRPAPFVAVTVWAPLAPVEIHV